MLFMLENIMTFQQKYKKLCKKCYFCEVSDYALLDVHRIREGKEYNDFNCIVVCSLCHRKIHAKKITIDRKYYRSDGRWVLHYFDEIGKEYYE